MDYKVAYDLDGVISSPIPPAQKKYRFMNGQERKDRKKELVEMYEKAELLFMPPEEEFLIITARKYDLLVISATEKWLKEKMPDKKFTVQYLTISRTLLNVIHFKATMLMKYNIKKFTEDNLGVLKGIKKIYPDCEYYFFKEKETIKI